MTTDLDLTLRTSSAYDLAHQAIEVMREHGVWPTPLSFELCLHYISDPDGPLGSAIRALVAEGKLNAEDWSEKLARQYLPRLRLQDQVSDAGEALTRELESIGSALQGARNNTAHLGTVLLTATADLSSANDIAQVRGHVDAIAQAARKLEAGHVGLETRLAESAREINHLREHMERIRAEAMTDPLTLLANRRAFEQYLRRACEHSKVRGRPLSLAMIDIDHFKKFNDRWGHQTGDQVLRYVGRLLTTFGASPRVAARYGGEEFALILPNETSASAVSVLNAFRDGLAARTLKRRNTGEDLGAITVSIGVAQFLQGETMESLIERADGALYLSKDAGRNCTTTAALALTAPPAAASALSSTPQRTAVMTEPQRSATP